MIKTNSSEFNSEFSKTLLLFVSSNSEKHFSTFIGFSVFYGETLSRDFEVSLTVDKKFCEVDM